MAYSSTIVDREVVHESFRLWQAEQAELDAQLVESVAALEAYQSHLDAWQRELAAERDELRDARTAFERDQAFGQTQHVQLDEIQLELNDAHHKIASLTGSLLARTEELREIDREHAGSNTELMLARAREKELMAAVESQQKAREEERQHWQNEVTHLRQQLERAGDPPHTYPNEPLDYSPAKSDPDKPANPVLGTVMQQFDKLRQQRSSSRPPYPRTR